MAHENGSGFLFSRASSRDQPPESPSLEENQGGSAPRNPFFAAAEVGSCSARPTELYANRPMTEVSDAARPRRQRSRAIFHSRGILHCTIRPYRPRPPHVGRVPDSACLLPRVAGGGHRDRPLGQLARPEPLHRGGACLGPLGPQPGTSLVSARIFLAGRALPATDTPRPLPDS